MVHDKVRPTPRMTEAMIKVSTLLLIGLFEAAELT